MRMWQKAHAQPHWLAVSRRDKALIYQLVGIRAILLKNLEAVHARALHGPTFLGPPRAGCS